MIRSPAAIVLAVTLQVFSVGAVQADALLRVDGSWLRWQPSRTAQVVITYALLTGPYTVPGNKSILSPSNCASMRAFSDIVRNSPKISEAAAKRELNEAFAAWEQAANLIFMESNDPRSANIVIGAQDIPEGKAFANLSYYGPRPIVPVSKSLGSSSLPSALAGSDAAGGESTAVRIDQAYICLNPKEAWKIGFDGNLDVYDLRYTFTHEIGHAIGLDHPFGESALMASRYDERVRTLQPSDIAAARRLYGPPLAGR